MSWTGKKKMFKQINFENYEKSIPELLDSLNFSELISKEKRIILKPNLTLNKKPPTTTPVEFVEEIAKYIKGRSKAELIITEGSGGDSTSECFKGLGYNELAEKYKTKLIDLNEAETVQISKGRFKKFKVIEYPKILLNSFLVSLPVLKEHIEATITIALKNMLGAFPARHYGGNWKTKMHFWNIDYAIHDILACKFPDFAICDASTGQVGNEVYGTAKKFGLLLAGDPLDVDKKGAKILGYNWQDIRHIRFASELVES